jgi:phytoene dehydrogenase-like protein
VTKKSIIIVGAGIGGLATGCYAQMNGYDSQIFEQHSRPGGLAATWKRKDYHIDGGIHFLSGHKPEIAFYNILKEVGVNTNDFIDMRTYTRFVDEKLGLSIDITNDLDKLHRDLLELSPEDRKTVDSLIAATRKVSKTDLSILGFEKPAELRGRKDALKDAWAVKGIWRYFSGKYNKSIQETVKNVHHPFLRDLLQKLFLPTVPYWFILMILAMVTTNQMCLLSKGAYEFAKSMEEHYFSLSGKITYSNGVKEILVENGKAWGVQLEDGQIAKSDYVISAADGYHTIFELLQGRYVDETIRKRYTEMQVLPPIIIISFGVTKEFQHEPWLIMVQLEEPIAIESQKTHDIFIRIFNYSSYFAPPGKTVIQVMFDTTWDFWKGISEKGGDYNEMKDKFAQEVVKRLEKHFPGIMQTIEVTDVATPLTFWRYTRSYQGTIMGWLPSGKNMWKQPQRVLPDLTNFYLAGQWAMSMGGVPPAIFSGRHVIQLICKKDSKRFTTTH